MLHVLDGFGVTKVQRFQIDLPLGVVRVLLGDLLGEGMVRIVSAQRQQLPDQRLLRMVLDGLESL